MVGVDARKQSRAHLLTVLQDEAELHQSLRPRMLLLSTTEPMGRHGALQTCKAGTDCVVTPSALKMEKSQLIHIA